MIPNWFISVIHKMKRGLELNPLLSKIVIIMKLRLIRLAVFTPNLSTQKSISVRYTKLIN